MATSKETAKSKIEAQAETDGVDFEKVHDPDASTSGTAPVIVLTWRARIDVKGKNTPIYYECREWPVGTFATPTTATT
jgi:hypothetical protein